MNLFISISITYEHAFIEQVQSQIQEGYYLAYIRNDKQVKALAGFKFLEFSAWGNFFYIDDLVCDTTSRKNAYGSKVLKTGDQRNKKGKMRSSPSG